MINIQTLHMIVSKMVHYHWYDHKLFNHTLPEWGIWAFLKQLAFRAPNIWPVRKGLMSVMKTQTHCAEKSVATKKVFYPSFLDINWCRKADVDKTKVINGFRSERGAEMKMVELSTCCFVNPVTCHFICHFEKMLHLTDIHLFIHQVWHFINLLFVNIPFYQLTFLSTCHLMHLLFVNLRFYQITFLSRCYLMHLLFVNLPFY